MSKYFNALILFTLIFSSCSTKKDILYIKTSNSAWRTELSFRKEKIKEELLKRDNNIKIKDIKFL